MSDAGSQNASVTVYSMRAAHVARHLVHHRRAPAAGVDVAGGSDVVVAQGRFRASGHRVEDLNQLIVDALVEGAHRHGDARRKVALERNLQVANVLGSEAPVVRRATRRSARAAATRR